MSLPHFTWITVTYGRPDYVNQVIASFLAQDVKEWCKLLILNTYPKQRLVGNFPNVEIVNLTERPPSLGAARNMAINLAPDDSIILCADDDDANLPNFTSTFAKHFDDSTDWVWLQKMLYAEAGVVKQIVSGSFNVVAYRKSAWKKIGGFNSQTVGEDRQFVGRLTAECPGKKVDLAPEDISFVYVWGQGPLVFHVSGKGERASAHDEMAAATEDLVRRGLIPTGDIQLKPAMQCDYPKLVKQFLDERKRCAEKKSDVCVVQLGRLGDIINILPICLHIHNTYAKPHVMVSREFDSLLDGVSYVTPYVVDLKQDQINEALVIARKEFKHVICTQVWGKNFCAEKLTPSYNMESWRVAGFLHKFNDLTWRPVFDKRDAEFEKKLVAKVDRNGKPFLIVNVTRSVSSPFDGTAILTELLRTLGEQFQIVDVSSLRLDHIYDLLGLMDRKGSVVCSIDTALLHLCTASNPRVLALVNPMPWLGTVPRSKRTTRHTYEWAVTNTKTICDHLRDELLESSPEAYPASMTPAQPPPRSIFHACERHAESDAREQRRKEQARNTWQVLYAKHGVIPAHLSSWARSAKGIGDPRDLPYVKDVLGFAMLNAGDEDVIMLTNDDLWLHPNLPDVLKFHCSLYGACASFRCEFDGQPEMKNSRYVSTGSSVGQDVFAFTKRWLKEHWQEIPDFIVGASEWDWCLTAIIRQSLGIQTNRRNIEQPIWPAEIETGYVAHQTHRPAWIHPENVNASPSQAHNKRLFSEWIARNMPEFKINQYPGMPEPASSAHVAKVTTKKPDGQTRYYHSGNLGDIIYALHAIKAAGGGELLIGPEQRSTAPCAVPTTREQFDMLEPLLRAQPYIRECQYHPSYPEGEIYDLNRFRNHWVNGYLRTKFKIDTLCKCHFYELGIVDKFNDQAPWIVCPNRIVSRQFIVHRSERYNSPANGKESFPWYKLVFRHASEMLFVGLESEWRKFQQDFKCQVAFHRVSDFLELTRMIAGGKCYVGNQSFGLSLALGVGQTVRCEAYPPSPDCRFQRDNYADQLIVPHKIHLYGI